MRKILILILIQITFMLIFIACTSNTGPEEFEISNVKNNLPVEFAGNFQWENDRAVQEVSMSFSEILSEKDGQVVALGTGVYKTDAGLTRIQVKMKIHPSTYKVSIWELKPDGSQDFVTEGSHIGHISHDLKLIEAIWTSEKSGQKGSLELAADYFNG